LSALQIRACGILFAVMKYWVTALPSMLPPQNKDVERVLRFAARRRQTLKMGEDEKCAKDF
jgi:hypothetical protein